MVNKFYDTIRYIIDNSTEDNKYNSKIFLSKLSDLSPESTEEIKILKRVITDDVLHRLILVLSSNNAYVHQNLIQEKKRLEDEFGLNESWSYFIVKSFAKAYGVDFVVETYKSSESNQSNFTTNSSETIIEDANLFNTNYYLTNNIKTDSNKTHTDFDKNLSENSTDIFDKFFKNDSNNKVSKTKRKQHINLKPLLYLFLGALFNPISLLIGIVMAIKGSTRENRKRGKMLCLGVVLSYFITFVIYIFVSV